MCLNYFCHREVSNVVHQAADLIILYLSFSWVHIREEAPWCLTELADMGLIGLAHVWVGDFLEVNEAFIGVRMEYVIIID